MSHAKVGDYVTFTIVARNNGPDQSELFVNTMDAWQGLMFGGSTSVNCGHINEPAPQPGSHGNDGPWCEHYTLLQAGDTVIETLIMQMAPTSSGYASDTACVAPQIDDPNPGNNCATATVMIDSETCSSGVPGATQTAGSVTYNLEGEDTFTKDAPLGSFASTDWTKIVYTGDHGMGWTEYPDGWPSTNSGSAEGYQPSTVQSVHDGLLDFYLHQDLTGNPVGADPSPMPNGMRYQIYGAWSFCERVVPTDYALLDDFHQAPLLWPQDTPNSPNDNWKWAESDFPEGDLNATSTIDPANQFAAYAHYGGTGAQDLFPIGSGFDPSEWHVYTQTWGPGFRSYYVDGQLVGTSTNQVWSAPERWQLQVEPSITGEAGRPGVLGAGHVYVKWVWIGTPSP